MIEVAEQTGLLENYEDHSFDFSGNPSISVNGRDASSAIDEHMPLLHSSNVGSQNSLNRTLELSEIWRQHRRRSSDRQHRSHRRTSLFRPSHTPEMGRESRVHRHLSGVGQWHYLVRRF